ncbi:hypothetical protein OESDEN_10731 [Oesophagostomum dentatum]|uniref:Uncharacterized protein n=1 Tax=Oesophagostomum dentatum TaxID=61180 RepID=A0A0B1T206_OESDE|nr:hypothetical protein OESDEN_10731 [Oesophagostomum dentatum]
MESNMLWVMENAHTVFPAFSVITTFMILFVIYFACLSRRKLPEEREKDHEHKHSIRDRKLRVALEQKKNIIRKKKDYNRLVKIMSKLRTKDKVELGKAPPPSRPKPTASDAAATEVAPTK